MLELSHVAQNGGRARWIGHAVFVTLSMLAIVPLLVASVSARAAEDEFQIRALSNRPDMLSGGDALVRVDVPARVALRDVRVTLDNTDVTGSFRAADSSHTLTGLLTGMHNGSNTLVVAPARGTNSSPSARLTLVNHPISGPVFDGPKQQPFICETEGFKLRSGGTLGPALDANCTVATRVDYVYRSTAGGDLKPLPDPMAPPADVATTTTLLGQTVPYVVRIETGTINRAIYQIAMLHNPSREPAPDFATRPAGWNSRLIYTFGGGCTNGWYRQGATTGGVEDDVMLRQGYGVASSTLNVFGNNCDDRLASETMMMVKERFVEAYGVPKLTIGMGCSGGSYQVEQIADNYPGLLDGIIPGCSFPDVAFGTVPSITDARLLNHYFTSLAAMPYSDEQKRAITGFVNLATMIKVDKGYAGRIKVDEYCPSVLPVALRYDPKTNPKGARCDIYDHAVNVYGRDPKTGFARRPLDNVGIQYGLAALNAGVIGKEQFLDLNEKIDGFDDDGNYAVHRSVADLEAVRIAYRTGRLLNGGGGLATTPVIDYRSYADDIPDGDVHLRYHSFSTRARLVRANGHADNHIMLHEDRRYGGGYTTKSPVLQEALTQMDRWLTRLTEDTSADSPIVKLRRAKPADLVDACWSRDAVAEKISEKQEYGSGRCEQLYPSASFPRGVAGAPVAADVIKCQLKPIDQADYKVRFTAEEMVRLKQIFSSGVCDWSKPGVAQQKLEGTWLMFNGS